MCEPYELQAVLDRLDKAAEGLVLAQKELMEDRRQIARLIVLVQRLTEGADVVAANLANSIERADDAEEVPGAAADAALRSAADHP